MPSVRGDKAVVVAGPDHAVVDTTTVETEHKRILFRILSEYLTLVTVVVLQ